MPSVAIWPIDRLPSQSSVFVCSTRRWITYSWTGIPTALRKRRCSGKRSHRPPRRFSSATVRGRGCIRWATAPAADGARISLASDARTPRDGSVTVEEAGGYRRSQAIRIWPPAPMVRLHLRLQCPSDMLHLRIAHLEAIHNLHFGGSKLAGTRIMNAVSFLPQLPVADGVRRNDVDVAVHAQPAMILAALRHPMCPMRIGLDLFHDLLYLDRDWYICQIWKLQHPKSCSPGRSPRTAIRSPSPPASRKKEWC